MVNLGGRLYGTRYLAATLISFYFLLCLEVLLNDQKPLLVILFKE